MIRLTWLWDSEKERGVVNVGYTRTDVCYCVLFACTDCPKTILFVHGPRMEMSQLMFRSQLLLSNLFHFHTVQWNDLGNFQFQLCSTSETKIVIWRQGASLLGLWIYFYRSIQKLDSNWLHIYLYLGKMQKHYDPRASDQLLNRIVEHEA